MEKDSNTGLPYLPAKSCKSVGSYAMTFFIRAVARPRGVVVSVVAVGLPEAAATTVDVDNPPRTPWSRLKPTRALLLLLSDEGGVPSFDFSKFILKWYSLSFGLGVDEPSNLR